MITHRIAVVSLALLLAGCSRSKTVSTPSGDVKVEQSGNQSTVTVTGDNGAKMTIAGEGTKLPDDYPKDVPVVGGAKIVMTTSATEGSSLIIESPDSFDKTVAFYKKAIADNGWKSDATVAAEKMTMYSATKDTRHLVIQIGESDGKCSVTQSVGKK